MYFNTSYLLCAVSSSLFYSQEIIRVLKLHFPDAEVRIDDQTGDGSYLVLTVCSADFKDKSLLEQHKMVKKTIEKELGRDIVGDKVHALQVVTKIKG